jgi:TATA-binding protein-associated factor
LDCGIGQSEEDVQSNADDVSSLLVKQHRVLIFAQLKSSLEIIEQDLFMKQMPSVTYLRLDGSVRNEDRFALVRRFNEDPSIDVLLLTTSVGGLGLNLTGADTVIFLEHDWNPSKDLQAMDRAHRIGQKKIVNVYRLITKGTLEEKVMKLQNFKTSIANSVVTSENASLTTMDTDQVLDLFSLSSTSRPGPSAASSSSSQMEVDSFGNPITKTGAKSGKQGALKSMLSNLGDLWDESQSEAQSAVDFAKTLKGKK